MNAWTTKAAALLLLAVPCVARADRIDWYVEAAMRRQKVPGLSLAIVEAGKVVRARGYGFANLEHGVPATADTVYQSGSLGKPFTAALVLLLAEEGLVDLDAPLYRYFPNAPARWKRVTVRNLLNHTSGIKDYDKRDVNFREDYTEELLFDIFAKFPMDFAPGSHYSYSNTGYSLLGMLIGKVTGEHHGDFLQKRIVAPLGLKATRVISEEDIVPNRSSGYRLAKQRPKHHEWVAPSWNTFADGCLYTTVLDLAQWDVALHAGKALNRASLARMRVPPRTADGKVNGYGLGWRVGEVEGRKFLEHGGAWQGFRGHLVRYLDDEVTVIVLANQSLANVERIAKEVAALHRGWPAPPPPRRLTVREPAVDGLVQALLAGLREGTLSTDLFTARMAAGFFPLSAEAWIEVLGNVGPLLSLAPIEHVGKDGWHRYLAEYEEVTIQIDLTVVGNRKIAGLYLKQV